MRAAEYQARLGDILHDLRNGRISPGEADRRQDMLDFEYSVETDIENLPLLNLEQWFQESDERWRDAS